MIRSVPIAIATLLASATLAEAGDPFRGIPAPVVTYAMQFDGDCESNGLGRVVPGEDFRLSPDQARDLNGDGTTDYIVYKCMFGCSGKPSAFTGIGSPCSWGSLLLSEGDAYKTIFVPGKVSGVDNRSGIRLKIKKPRALQIAGNFCKDGIPNVDLSYVYALTDGRFQLEGKCPPDGCDALLTRTGLSSPP